MKRSITAVFIVFGGLVGCGLNRIDGRSGTDRTPWDLLARHRGQSA